MQCGRCRKEVFLPFRCPYCGEYFCSEHRLPENHECPRIDLARSPSQMKSAVIMQNRSTQKASAKYFLIEHSRKHAVHFTVKEVQHLTIASLLVAAIALSSLVAPRFRLQSNPLALAALSTMVVVSFLAHEMAHKIMAQKHGFWAEFRLTLTGAALTLFSIISPYFKIISPGTVVVSGLGDMQSLGKVSIAGPITNILFSTISLAATYISDYNVLTQIFLWTASFNAYIALFNLIPLGILDGFKVFQWNKKAWVSAFTASLLLTYYCFTLTL